MTALAKDLQRWPSPATPLSVQLRTGGFASPPCDGFAQVRCDAVNWKLSPLAMSVKADTFIAASGVRISHSSGGLRAASERDYVVDVARNSAERRALQRLGAREISPTSCPRQRGVLWQRQHLNAALGGRAGPNARLHSRGNADPLPAAGRIADDAAADRLAGIELVQDCAGFGVERA